MVPTYWMPDHVRCVDSGGHMTELQWVGLILAVLAFIGQAVMLALCMGWHSGHRVAMEWARLHKHLL
mgnify:CR=1 FL=1